MCDGDQRRFQSVRALTYRNRSVGSTPGPPLGPPAVLMRSGLVLKTWRELELLGSAQPNNLRRARRVTQDVDQAICDVVSARPN